MLFCPSIHVVVSHINMSKDNQHVEFIQYCKNLICEISSLSVGREPESSDLRTSSILQSLTVSIYRYLSYFQQAKAASTAPVGEKIEKDIPQPVASPQTSSGKPSKGGKGGGGDKKSKKQKKKFARHKVRSDSREVEDFYDVIEDPAETQVASKQHGGLGDVPEQTEDRGPGRKTGRANLVVP